MMLAHRMHDRRKFWRSGDHGERRPGRRRWPRSCSGDRVLGLAFIVALFLGLAAMLAWANRARPPGLRARV